MVRSADVRIVRRIVGLARPTTGEIGCTGNAAAVFIEILGIRQHACGQTAGSETHRIGPSALVVGITKSLHIDVVFGIVRQIGNGVGMRTHVNRCAGSETGASRNHHNLPRVFCVARRPVHRNLIAGDA